MTVRRRVCVCSGRRLRHRCRLFVAFATVDGAALSVCRYCAAQVLSALVQRCPGNFLPIGHSPGKLFWHLASVFCRLSAVQALFCGFSLVIALVAYGLLSVRLCEWHGGTLALRDSLLRSPCEAAASLLLATQSVLCSRV